jgi:hypothetical protein
MGVVAEQEHVVVVDENVVPNDLRFPSVFNVAAPFIDRHVKAGRGGAVAVRCAGREITYSELAGNVGRAGNALLELGLAPGSRLIMAALDDPYFLYVFWGAIKAGIIPIAASTFVKTADYRLFIEDADCEGFVYSSGIASQAAGVENATPRLRFVLPTDGPVPCPSASPPPRRISIRRRHRPPTTASGFIHPVRPAPPKGVVHRHRDMVVTSERYGRRIAGIEPDDIVFCASKLFFSFGFGGGMTFPLWMGASTVLQPDDRRARSRYPRTRAGLGFFRRAHPLRTDGSRVQAAPAPSFPTAMMPVGRRSLAGAGFPSMEGAHRRADPGRHRVDRGASCFHLEPDRRHTARNVGQTAKEIGSVMGIRPKRG